MSLHGGPHVEFGMYPFASVEWAWDELWAAVHARVPWTPELLSKSGDVHARWYDADCVITQVCGGPFAALHRNDMHLVGAFSLNIPEADGGHYHSVLVSPHELPLDELSTSATHAVANSADSLSGWFSLIGATVGPGNPWPGPVTFTSAHYDSLAALAAGEADIASIDAWSLALIGAERPDLVDGLHRVTLGPRIPTPPVTARRNLSPEQVDELRSAFADAVSDPATSGARSALRVDRFVDNSLDDYLAVLPLLATP